VIALTRRATLGGGLLALAACASMRDPAPGVLRIGSGFDVTLTRVWSDFTPPDARAMRLISIDGPTLNRLYLAGGLRPGEGLAARKSQDRQAFHAGMSDEDLIAFVRDSVDALGFARPETASVRAAKFGAADGLRIDMETRTGDGLEFSATALIAEHAGRLNVILYLAAKEHYYAATLPDVEAIMASAVLR
jgi:hypothetical protein